MVSLLAAIDNILLLINASSTFTIVWSPQHITNFALLVWGGFISSTLNGTWLHPLSRPSWLFFIIYKLFYYYNCIVVN